MRKPRNFLFYPGALCVSIVLTGCTVGPQFERPAAPDAQRYTASSLSDVKGGPRAVLGEGPAMRWWEAFDSPELNALVERAIAHNYSLKASNATLERARQRIAAVAGKQLPQVDANARVEHEQINLAGSGFEPGALPGLASNPEFDLYTVGGGISYDLDLFGGTRRGLEQVSAQAESQRYQTEAAHLTVAGRVVNQVLTIAGIRARIATADALIAEDQHNVDLTETRRRAGEGTLTEVLNAQAQLANDRSELPQFGQQLAEARNMLAILVGVTPAELGPTEFDLTSFALPAQVPVTLPSALVHKRPDILQAEADLQAATAAIGVATARLYPDIRLGATLTQGAPDPGDVLSSAFRGFDIFAGLTAPIFHGGTLKAEQREAMSAARASAATYQQTVLEAFSQVANLLQAINSDQLSMNNQQQAVDVAARSLHLSRRSFQVGNSGLLQVLESERLYQRATSGLVEAKTRQYLNVARLYVATAGGWSSQAMSNTDEVSRAGTQLRLAGS